MWVLVDQWKHLVQGLTSSFHQSKHSSHCCHWLCAKGFCFFKPLYFHTRPVTSACRVVRAHRRALLSQCPLPCVRRETTKHRHSFHSGGFKSFTFFERKHTYKVKLSHIKKGSRWCSNLVIVQSRGIVRECVEDDPQLLPLNILAHFLNWVPAILVSSKVY